MQNSFQPTAAHNPFKPAWIVIAALISLQFVYIALCHGFETQLRQPFDVDTRVLLRTVFYALAIVILPLSRLLRYILCRLNQTMPGEKTAPQRYLTTVIVSQMMIEPVGLFGLLMFVLGDGFNTLYIFSGMAILGFLLHRPKEEEYEAIVTAIKK
jgi:hypothetical protein